MIDIRDQYKKTLSLDKGHRQRYDTVLQSLAEVDITREHEQIAPEPSPLNDNDSFETSTDESQGQITSLDDFLDAVSHFSADIYEALPFCIPCASLLGSSLE